MSGKKSLASLIITSLIFTGCGTNEILLNTPENNYNVTPSPVFAQPQANIPAANNPVLKNDQTPVKKDTTLVKTTVSANNPTTAPLTVNKEITSAIESKKTIIAENYNVETILAGLKTETDLNKAKELAGKYNIKFGNFIKGINTVVYTTNGQNVPDLIKKVSTESIFSFVETDNVSSNKPEKETDIIDKLFSLFAAPAVNDKYFNEQYGLKALKVPESWELSTGKNTIISIIDSGVDMNHEDLKIRLHPGYDAFSQKDGENAGNVSKLNYIATSLKHGSHVAGIAAAEFNNGKGIAGVAPEAKILPVKIFPDFTDFFKTAKKNPDGSDVTVVSAIADGIVWSTDHHADVINMSLGVWDQSATLERAVKYALDHNVSVVVAAGNERAADNKRNYLAAINGVIAVGATDSENKITYFSNSGDYVSVAAPGYDIISSVPSLFGLKEYKKMSGTSMAAPHVAGVVALLKSKFGALATPQWVKQRLEKTATDLGVPGRDDLYGHGLVNAYKALNDPV